jgi:hypothetical protein
MKQEVEDIREDEETNNVRDETMWDIRYLDDKGFWDVDSQRNKTSVMIVALLICVVELTISIHYHYCTN